MANGIPKSASAASLWLSESRAISYGSGEMAQKYTHFLALLEALKEPCLQHCIASFSPPSSLLSFPHLSYFAIFAVSSQEFRTHLSTLNCFSKLEQIVVILRVSLASML